MIKFEFKNESSITQVSINEADLEFIDGYSSVYFNIEGLYYNGVIDKDYQIVIPFFYEEKEEDFSGTTIFEGQKAIYGIKNEEFYLVDLKTVKFKEQNGRLYPTRYDMKFEGYGDVDTKRVIIYKEKNFFLYDVCDNQKLSFDFDYMLNDEDSLKGSLFLVPEINAPEFLLNCTLNKDGQIQNPLHLGNISIWLNDTLLQEKDTALEEVSKIYQKELKSKFCWNKVLH